MKRAVLVIFVPDEEDVTAVAVSSLLSQLREEDTLLLLNNGGPNRAIREKYSSLNCVQYFESDKNLGVAGGRNLLLRQPICMDADVIFLVDSDAFVPSDYLDRMTAFIVGAPETGIAGPIVLSYPELKPKLLELGRDRISPIGTRYLDVDTSAVLQLIMEEANDKTIDHMGTNANSRDVYFTGRMHMDGILGRSGYAPKAPFRVSLKNDPQSINALVGREIDRLPVTNVAGCCQVFRASLVKEIGVLYEGFNPYGLEDVDFSLRALESGRKNYTTNASFMFHKTDGRHAQRSTPDRFFDQAVNSSRVWTILEYRWCRDAFPKVSYRRVLLRGLHEASMNENQWGRTNEVLIAEAFGIQQAFVSLAKAEGEEFVTTILDNPNNADLPIDLESMCAEALASERYSNAKEAPAIQRVRKRAMAPQNRRKASSLRFDIDAMSFTKRVVGRNGQVPKNYVSSKQDQISLAQRDRLRAFRNIHKGQRCFIIGNGPSLKKTDFCLLRNEISFGVNGIFYMFDDIGFAPTYYVVEDNHVMDDNLERIIHFPAKAKFFPSRYEKMVGWSPGTHFLPTNWEFYYKSSPHFETPRFSRSAEETIYVGQTVTYLNLQLAYYMGFEEVILVGVDFSYEIPKSSQIDGFTILSHEDDPNHFHPAYFGKGKKWHLPKLENCERAYRHARVCFEEDNRRVLDATIDGKLQVYEKSAFYDLFGSRPLLQRPNAPLVYFVHAILREEIDSVVDGSQPTFSWDPLSDDAVNSDLEALARWLAESRNGGKKLNDGTHGTVSLFAALSPSDAQVRLEAVRGGVAIIAETDFFEPVTDGRLRPSGSLVTLLESFRYVLLHKDFALASNARLPTFLERDFGFSLDDRETIYVNPRAALVQAQFPNATRCIFSTDIPRMSENVYDVPGASHPCEDDLDVSLAKGLLEIGTPVLFTLGRLFFPR